MMAMEDNVREDLSDIEIVVNATELVGEGVGDGGEGDGVVDDDIAVVDGGSWAVEVVNT